MYFSRVNLGRWRSGTICTGSRVFQRYCKSSVVQPSVNDNSIRIECIFNEAVMGSAAALYRLHNFNSGVQSTNKKEVSVGKVGVVVASWRHYCRRVSKRIYRVGPTRLTAPINLVDSIYLQLATRSEHFCRSSGYSFKFIGHASVSDTLQERNETSLGIDRHIGKKDSEHYVQLYIHLYFVLRT